MHAHESTPLTGALDSETAKPKATACFHEPVCPAANAIDREAARTIAAHPEQGWSLLCNGLLFFEDTGALLPDGVVIEPHRPLANVA